MATEERRVRKLIDKADILEDLIYRITPQYFPDETFDKNRSSIYGFITEAMAQSFEDTIVLEQRRAQNYCPELSTSEIHVNQTAKLRSVEVKRATPGRCFALLGILKSDILKKATPYGNEMRFILDRRSTILYGGINYSLEDDIIIRAVKRGNEYLYAANYTGEHSSYESYLQVYEETSTQGEELLALVAQIYQCKYNIAEKHVVDLLEFTYDGKYFDYDDKLASFEVYYKKSSQENFRKVETMHYLSEAANRGLYYNDDESGILKILNNPTMNLGANAVIRVEMRETLGSEGNITLNADETVAFQMYRDASYTYAGIHVWITMLGDTSGGADGDDMAEVKRKLIREKTTRNNITTEHDIITYINDRDANVQIVKKRNDIQDRNYFMYVLMRYNDPDLGDRRLAPATTKRLNISGFRDALGAQYWGDFDRVEATVNRKIIRAYSKFKLHIVDGEPDSDYVTKVPIDENDEKSFYLTCPYMILINELNIAYYYFTSVDEEVTLSMKAANNFFPYQMICRTIHVFRDSHDKENHNQYTFTIKAVLNTENDEILVDEDGELIDREMVYCHVFFPMDGNPNAYLPMAIDSYDEKSREFTFTGTCKTSDYITENDKLEIPNGLLAVGTTKNYNSVVDYRDASFLVSFMYKQPDPDGAYGRSDAVYTMLPERYTKEYVLMNSYYNNPYNLYNLVLEFSKFSRSPVKLTRVGKIDYDYSIGAVPFFEYEFGTEWTHKLYPSFKQMADTYGNLLKLTTDFEVALKFIATYGDSKYIQVTGGQYPNEYESTVQLHDLNPTFYFKVYGFGAPVEDIRQYIYEYLRDTYTTGNTVYISNICTAIEDNFPAVKSIKYMGVNDLDGSYQEFTYVKPKFYNWDTITRYVPEQLNVTNIQIELDENA